MFRGVRRRVRGLCLALAAAGTVIAACSSSTELVFDFAWSETLYMPLSLLALLAWSVYLEDPRRTAWLVGAATATGCVLLTRHAGVALPIAVGCVSLRMTDSAGRVRSLAALALCALPYMAWLVHVWQVTETLAGATRYDGGGPMAELALFANGISRWLLPHVIIEDYGMVIIGGTLAVAAVLALRYPRPPAAGSSEAYGRRRAFARVLGSYAVCYVAVLITMGHAVRLSSFAVDATRYLAPLQPVLLLLALDWLDGRVCHFRAHGAVRAERAFRAAAALWFTIWLAAPNRLSDTLLGLGG